ncbi:MAG TPA: alpha/beta hydrolase, partial [Chondromyces sp.]|nr:alpha/beta hydrolase [Chondromyces sp.]
MSIPASPPPEAWTEWGGRGTLFHFGHANGFPPGAYRQLLGELSRSFRVATLAARPLWPGSDPGAIDSWRPLAADLRAELDRRHERGGIGAGHSLGSVLSVLAAVRDPSLFSALVLVDPVIFTGAHSLFWGLFKGLGLGGRLPLIRGARRRREVFPDLETVRSSYAGKSVFATWLPKALDDYVRAAFSGNGEGSVALRYPKAWEARIFEVTPADVWRELHRLPMPILVVRGARSDTFRPAAARRIRRELPSATVVEMEGCSHFVPMERPRELAALIV